DLRILDQQVGVGDLLLDAVHVVPQALFVLVGRLEPGADQRNHVGGADSRACDAGMERRGGDPSPDQQRAARQLEAAEAHQRAACWRRTPWPGFIRPSNRSTICAAPCGVRRSPNLIPGTWLAASTTWNHPPPPVLRSTSDA